MDINNRYLLCELCMSSAFRAGAGRKDPALKFQTQEKPNVPACKSNVPIAKIKCSYRQANLGTFS